MEVFFNLVEVILHLDKYLNFIAADFGLLTYLLLFLIIFAETGLVVTPFLPGDSLLFAAGALSAVGIFDPVFLFLVLFLAAVLGDSLNYWIGSFLGVRAFAKGNSRFFRRKYLLKTQDFYQRHGAKTIVLARFIPIIRTFAPFVAGIGTMRYGKFIIYNIVGGFFWVALFVFGGYYFGNLNFVRNNFGLVIGVIIVISILPLLVEFLKGRRPRPA